MKCAACQYENVSGEWNSDKLQRHPEELDKEDFIEINGNHTVERERFAYSTVQDSVRLFACPKCFTVQMQRW